MQYNRVDLLIGGGAVKEKRNYSLDMLKILASLIIMFHHYQDLAGVVFPSFNFAKGSFNFGNVVQLFFVISGFLICDYMDRIPEKVNFSAFFIKRCIRLLPMTALTAAAYVAVSCLVVGGSHFWGWCVSAFGLFSIGGNLQIYNVNPPSWYVSSLLICYIWFFGLVYWGKKRNLPLQWLFGAMVILGLSIDAFGVDLPLFNVRTSCGYYAFFWGALLRIFVKRNGASKAVKGAAAAIIAAFAAICIYMISFVQYDMAYTLSFFVFPAMVVLCYTRIAGRLFRYPWIGRLGEISFGVYLWHTPLYMFMEYLDGRFFLGMPWGTRWFMLLFGAITFAVAAATYYLFERPLTRCLTRKYDAAHQTNGDTAACQ